MVDGHSLIEFLRTFKQHRRHGAPSSDPSSQRPRRMQLTFSATRSRGQGRGRLFPTLYNHSPLAVVDALVLLAAPYVRMLATEAQDVMDTCHLASPGVDATRVKPAVVETTTTAKTPAAARHGR